MPSYLIVLLTFAWLAILVGGWLGWQLLRQNGRILLRLEEVEKRLEELEFGEPGESGGQANGETRDQNNARPHPDLLPRGEGEERADRFSNRSLARSRIKRDGLKAGTSAPSFRLPRLDGGELSLEELRGKRVLLVFSDPHCGPCNALAPELEKFHRQVGRVTPCARPGGDLSESGAHGVTRPTSKTIVVMISRSEPNENRAKVKEHGLTFPVVLQRQWEVSRLYAIFATPVAYLIDETGIITHDVAVGVEPILGLMKSGDEVCPQQ